MDKNKKIATLLESLCERPFEGDPQGRPPAASAMGSRIAQALPNIEAQRSGSASEPADSGPADNPGRLTAELAAILSGTAATAPCQVFQEAAVASGAVRLEAQSALDFVEGIEQAPLAAPAHLLEQVLAPGGGAPATSKPGIWSRIARGRLGRRPAQVVAACAVMLMAGGLSWSLLWRPAELGLQGAAVPTATNPKEAPSLGDILAEPSPAPAPAPAPMPAASAPTPEPVPLAPASPQAPAPVLMPAPALAPTRALPPAPKPGLVVAPASAPQQAFADPCQPSGLPQSEAGAPSRVEAAKPAPKPSSKTAALPVPDPGCAVSPAAVDAGRNPLADVGPVPAARPAAKIGRSDRGPPAAAASAPAAATGAARPPTPIMHPSAIQPAR